MPHHKDAAKRMRQNEVRRSRNRHYRSAMRTEIKKIREAIASGDAAVATAELPQAVSMIQAVAKKGIIHPKQAARRVSRLAKAINGLSKG